MKLITFVIPSYNSADYLHYALDSLICGGENIEVLIINDGSKDSTHDVAKKYQDKYPNIFKVIDQENQGHGGGINHGVKLAKGKYLKVLDSDDWVDKNALLSLIEYIKKSDEADLIVTDYTYYSGREHRHFTVKYKKFIKPNTLVTFNEVKKFIMKENLTLHSTMYKTSLLKDHPFELPLHVSYEDNFFVYYPMPFVKKLIYYPIDLYQYLIGRDGQSMDKETIKKKYKDFITCATLAFHAHDITQYKKTSRGLYNVMAYHLGLNCSCVPMSCRMNKSQEALKALNDFVLDMKKTNYKQYKIVSKHSKYIIFNTKTIFGKLIFSIAIWFTHKVIHLF